MNVVKVPWCLLDAQDTITTSKKSDSECTENVHFQKSVRKQPSSIKLCIYIIRHSEVETFRL